MACLHQLKGSIATITIIGVVLVSIIEGGFKIKTDKFTLDLTTDGLIEKIIQYQDHQNQRNEKDGLLKKYTNEFKIQSPQEIVDLINSISEKTESQEKANN